MCTASEEHRTPYGTAQPFTWAVLRRRQSDAIAAGPGVGLRVAAPKASGCLQGASRWGTAQKARPRLAVSSWITCYNTRRRHADCGHLSPNTYENISTTLPLRPAA